MMKKLRLLLKLFVLQLCLLVLSFSAKAQFPEGFEGGVPPTGWETTNSLMYQYEYGYHSGSYSAFHSNDYYGTMQIDTLITPQITVNTGDKITYYAKGTASITVLWSTDKITWTELGTPVLESYSYKTDPFEVVFTNTESGTGYVGFKLDATSSFTNLYLDDVDLIQVLGYDAEMTELKNPDNTIIESTEDVIVSITDKGSNTLTSLTIDWWIDDVAQIPFNWTGTLLTGESEDVLLGNNFFSAGTVEIKATASNPNGNTDENSSNNTITQNVNVYPLGTILETEPNNTWDASGVIDLTDKTGIGSIESYGNDFWSVNALKGQILTATLTCDGYANLVLFQEETYITALTSGEGYGITIDGTYQIRVSSLSNVDFDYTLEVSLESDIQSPDFTSVPENKATDVRKGTEIEITFDELVYSNDGSALDATNLLNCFDIKEGSATGSDLTYTAAYTEATKKVVLTPSADLNYGTDYYVMLAAGMIQDIAGNFVKDSTYYFTTKVAPVIVTMPINEGFETETFPPANWELTIDGAGWTRETNSADVTFPEGLYGAKHLIYSGASTLRTPIIDMSSAIAPRIKFKWQNTPGYFGGLACKVNVSIDGGSTFTEVYNVDAPDENWIDAKIDLVDLSNEMIIEFKLENDFSYPIYLDDISIAEKPTTPIFKISSESHDFGSVDLADENNTYTFSVINDGGGTMNLTDALLSGTDAAEFEILNSNIPAEITTAPFDLEVKFNPESEGAKTAVLNLTVDGLDHAINLTGEGHDSEIKELPYKYGFEDVDIDDGEEFNQDWTVINSIGGYSWCKVKESSPKTGVNALNMYNASASTGNLLAIMPISNIDVTGSLFSFYAKISGTAVLEFGYVTDPTDASTFVKLQDLNVSMVYTNFVVDLSSMSVSGSYYFAFRHGLSSTYQSIFIDDIRWAVPSNDATLSDLTSNFATVDGFTPDVYNYNVVLRSGATLAELVGATANSEYASVEITQATSVPGNATVLVTSEDDSENHTYTINYTNASADDASLMSVSVNGENISDFDPAIFTYDVELPFGTTVIPVVIGIATDGDADVVLNDAGALPGTTEIAVTSADDSKLNTYKVNFTVAKNNDATLSDLKVDDATIANFNAATLSYNVELAYGTTVIPTVTGVATDLNASVEITAATELPGKTSVKVTAEDNVTTKTYEVNFTFVTNNVATLSDLKVDGSTVADFNAATLSYNVELAYGTTVIPTVIGVATDLNASVEIVAATELPGKTTVKVTAEDNITTETYEVNFTVAKNTDATLSDLKFDGSTVANFDAATLSYDVELPYETTTIPVVAGIATDSNAEVEITAAAELPGTTNVKVIAEDGVTSLTYKVNFTIANPGTDATLSDLKVDGTMVVGFDAETIIYNVELVSGTTSVPVVTATATDANANVDITEATELPGTTTVKVIAEDITTSKTYTVNFTVATGIDFALEQSTKVYPIPNNGEFVVDLGYNIQNKGTWTLTNLSGQIIAHGTVSQSRFEVKSYTKGIYILSIEIDQQKLNKRIIIE